MGNNSIGRMLRDYTVMVITLVVLYCGIIGKRIKLWK